MDVRALSRSRYVRAVGLLSALCVGLFFIRVLATGHYRYWFVPENLLLAWLPVIFSWMLIKQLRVRSWLSWQCITATILWLVFLPNTWYVLTDFVHIFPTGEVSQLYDIVMISSLTIVGFILGFTSLYAVHIELKRRMDSQRAGWIVAAILLLSSFAIYLGRDLRWNTWDVITNPAGLILDVSDRVIDPFGHPRFITITGLFFVLLGAIYAAIWIMWPGEPSKKHSS